MKIAVAQANPVVGDLSGNRKRIIDAAKAAAEGGAELVVFPELALLGYSPRDLFHRRGFLSEAQREFERVVEASRDIGIVIGHVAVAGEKEANRSDPSATSFGGDLLLHNVVYLLSGGAVVGYQTKQRLPSFDVFEEERYFTPGSETRVLEWHGLRLGLSVCEDFWYRGIGVLAEQAKAGVDLLINVSASPYFRGKPALRYQLGHAWAELANAPLIYANLVGGQDELIFDGQSFAIRPDGAFLLAAPAFEEGVFLLDTAAAPVPRPPADGLPELKGALELGIRDYIEKNGLKGVLVGVSGGIDSALVATLAVQALGKDRVIAVFLPGPHTSRESFEEAHALARNLGIKLFGIPITGIVDAIEAALAPQFSTQGLVIENLQARVRGNVLMAVSNATGYVVLCPGNKSEIAMGYNTLYGDTVGALAPIGDLLKKDVYELSRYINEEAGREIIPSGTLTRPPTAELRPNQRDDQDLPPYEKLDPLLEDLLVNNLPWEELVARHGEPVVKEATARLKRSEYKRKQLPPVLKVSPKAFGIGRRWPITNRFSR